MLKALIMMSAITVGIEYHLVLTVFYLWACSELRHG